MSIEIVRNDITKMHVDAIVNAANTSLLGGGGVDGAIHAAAGSELLAECRTLNGCRTGEAKATKGYKLNCRYIIHTVGPVWQGGKHGEEKLLYSCYKNSLELADSLGCQSVAFPLISTGVYGYPKDKALNVAVRAITDFLATHDTEVYIVVFTRDAVEVSKKLLKNVKQYIDDVYVQAHEDTDRESLRRRMQMESPIMYAEIQAAPPMAAMLKDNSLSLEDMLSQVDEGFTGMLFRKIDEKHMSDVECYKRANIDRRHFSKIRSNPDYRPTKQTAIAFAIALKLNIAETKELLMKAGFALSHSSKGDICIEYFIMNGIYDIMQINEVLFSLDLPMLGNC